MSSLIVALLAKQPTAELERIRDTMRADLARLPVELEQVEDALALRTGDKASRDRASSGQRRAAKPGSTRQRILDIVGAAPGAVSPAEVKRALSEQGHQMSDGGLHTTIRRLAKAGELRRIAEGQYILASQDFEHAPPSIPADAESNGAQADLTAEAPLFRANSAAKPG